MKDWEIIVQFKNYGKGKNMFGDGFAFWYVKEKTQLGPVFGSKDYFHGLAIFFDTYNNKNRLHNVSIILIFFFNFGMLIIIECV